MFERHGGIDDGRGTRRQAHTHQEEGSHSIKGFHLLFLVLFVCHTFKRHPMSTPSHPNIKYLVVRHGHIKLYELF